MSEFEPFSFQPSLLAFLDELAKNNNREWFRENKERYDTLVMEPAFAFIEAMSPRLANISPHFTAVPKRVGGSLMRVYRDVRYSKDKLPYKTNVGIQFRHELRRTVHAPAFYVHIAADECFVGAGSWHPPSKALASIREYIVDNPASWKRARDHKPFQQDFSFSGESLVRGPAGYSREHPLIEDLKRKDFIAIAPISREQLHSENFVDQVDELLQRSVPLMRYLCGALDIPF